MSRVYFSRQTDEWATPQDLFDDIHAEFGFTLDAAATAENTKCPRFWTAQDDALAQEWTGCVWLNPPYSQCRAFIAKAARASHAGATVVALVPARTDTRWFHEHVWSRETGSCRAGVELRFLKGRLRFGSATAGAPFPSVVIIFRAPTERAIE